MTVSDAASVVPFINQITVVNTLTVVQPGTAHGSPVNFAFDCTGANMLILTFPFSSPGITGITYNGVALTKDIDTGFAEIWRLNSPTTGTNNISVSGGLSDSYLFGAFAIAGIDTTNALAGTTSSASLTPQVQLSVPVTSNVWSIGFMVRSVVDTGLVVRTFTPDTINDIEDIDTSLSSDRSLNAMHHIFTRTGSKRMGSTYTGTATSGTNEAVMALYNGLPWV